MKTFFLCLLLALYEANAFVPSSASPRRSFLTRTAVTKELSPEEKAIALEKATKAMTAFTNKYLELSCTKLCSDKSVPSVVIKGLAEHKVTLGAPLCPCRFYDDKEAEAKDGFWNCPCVPMRERQECHCMLFLTDDNQFAGEETKIEYDEVIELAKGMDM
jgi:ferredoxin-thioredoxin reductase catalytic chain